MLRRHKRLLKTISRKKAMGQTNLNNFFFVLKKLFQYFNMTLQNSLVHCFWFVCFLPGIILKSHFMEIMEQTDFNNFFLFPK